MNRIPSWDDLRVVLAIHEKGTLSAAARTLHVSHATVFRRLNEIESNLGVRLFNRTHAGYAATPAGEKAVVHAQAVSAEITSLEHAISGEDLQPSGPVRITTTDTLLDGLLAAELLNFRRRYPEIQIKVSVSNDLYDLSRRDADLALRPSNVPPATMIGRKVGTIAQAVYCNPSVIEPEGALELSSPSLSWIGPGEDMRYPALVNWMEHRGYATRNMVHANTVAGMLSLARAGHGFVALPCYLAEPDPLLLRVSGVVPELATDLWILHHPSLRGTARIRLVSDHIFTRLRAAIDLIEGAHLSDATPD